eukprot:3223979-Rhodomonas_salina.1
MPRLCPLVLKCGSSTTFGTMSVPRTTVSVGASPSRRGIKYKNAAHAYTLDCGCGLSHLISPSVVLTNLVLELLSRLLVPA